MGNEVKLLYHGTSAKHLDSIKENGILPRSITKAEDNWKHTISSNKDAVYLTDTYAWHFAANASKKDEKGLIIEIDRTKLYSHCLCPDEDFLEQVTRQQEPPEYPNFAPLDWDMKERTIFYRKIAQFNQQLTDMSLEKMGTCGYYNEIPWDAITRYVIIDWELISPQMHLRAIDSQVSVLNYKVLNDQHRALTRWFFGDEVKPEELTGFDRFKVLDENESMFEKYNKHMTEAMSIRNGIQIFSLLVETADVDRID